MSTDLDLGPRRSRVEAQPAVVKLQYGQIGMMQLRIGTTDTGALLDELTGRVATAPKFFQRTPVCLDLGELDRLPEIEEVRAVIDAVRRAGMVSIGLAGGSADIETLSAALNLPVLSAFRAANNPFPAANPVVAAPVQPTPPVAVMAASAEAGLAAMIQSQTVRSGQRIYARDRDLVITAGVGAGAEVMADGCVHIYGSLRGRAMAGVHGQLSARVFCQEFNAELVSIAGIFRVFETIPRELVGKPVQAWLDGEDLHFAPLGN